jgi:ATP-dependent Clp protease ATP-binding subunit ClpA
MTTNLGSQNRESIGWVKPEKKDFTGPIKNYFRPEFFNRIDHLLVFNPLNNETIRSIAIKELGELNLREGFQKKSILLAFSDSAVDFITAIGFDKNLGARPLQRAIDRYITVGLAKYFLQNPTVKNSTLFVDCIEDKIVID